MYTSRKNRSGPAALPSKTAPSFVRRVRGDISDMRPRDMIDMQSFLWVQGSDEYPDKRDLSVQDIAGTSDLGSHKQ